MKSPWSVSRMGENRTSGLMSGGVETGPLKDTAPPLDSTKSSTALRNIGAGAALVGCATLQGVDPASPAHQLEAHTSTRSSFARYELGDVACSVGGVSACGLGSEICGLNTGLKSSGESTRESLSATFAHHFLEAFHFATAHHLQHFL